MEIEPMIPKGVLIDCGGTLLDEISYNLPAGDAWMLCHSLQNPSNIDLKQISERRAFIEREVVVRRDQCRIETPWTVITRLVYDYFNIQLGTDWENLELEF